MLPVIRVFGFTIILGPLLTLAALMLGAEIAGRALARLSPREGQAWRQAFGNASLWAFLAGLVGARLWYAALHSAIYQENPWLLLSLRPDALAYLPGLTLGLGCLVVLLRRKGVPLAALADAIATGSAAALAIFAVRDYLVGIGYGVPLQLLWAPDMEGLRHPVQLYEATLEGLTLFTVLWWIDRRPTPPGTLFWTFITGYGLSRLIVELFREPDQHLGFIFGPITMGQILSIPMVVVGAAMLIVGYYKASPTYSPTK